MAQKILIVDDEADVRIFLETLLKESGFETSTANDGDTGFDKLKEFKPDLVTLDIIMPHETGHKFYRRLLKDPETKDIPVIILSGVTRYKELFARDHKTMKKPFAFVEKPIVPEQLVEKVKEALSSRRPA